MYSTTSVMRMAKIASHTIDIKMVSGYSFSLGEGGAIQAMVPFWVSSVSRRRRRVRQEPPGD